MVARPTIAPNIRQQQQKHYTNIATKHIRDTLPTPQQQTINQLIAFQTAIERHVQEQEAS